MGQKKCLYPLIELYQPGNQLAYILFNHRNKGHCQKVSAGP